MFPKQLSVFEILFSVLGAGLQEGSSVRLFLVVVAARPILRIAVIKLKQNRPFNCRLVLTLICTFHSKNTGITAVAMSHTHPRAEEDQLKCLPSLYNYMTLTSVDLVRDDHKVLGEAFGIRNDFPVGSKWYTRHSYHDAGIESHSEVRNEHPINAFLVPFFVRWK